MELSNKAVDITDRRFGRLVAVEPVSKNKHGKMVWLCLCDCGVNLEVSTNSLTSGNTRSCGCLHRQRASEANTKGFNNCFVGKFDVVVYLGHKACAYIDTDDLMLVSRYRWLADKDGYVVTRLAGGGRLLMHRLLLADSLAADLEVDHRNGIRFDNRRSNIRVVTKAQNTQNITVVRSKSGYKGVHQHANSKGWVASINVGCVRHYLGTHPTKEAAAKAYNLAAVRLCDDICLNAVN